MTEGRVWQVQSTSENIPIRQQFIECLEKLESMLLEARKAIPGDINIDYEYALPTIIFAKVKNEIDDSGQYISYLEMTCYNNRREFKRVLEDEQTQSLPEKES